MSIQEIKEYIALCLKGEGTIPERKVILEHKRAQLVERIAEIQASIDYIDWKQGFYDDVLAGRKNISAIKLSSMRITENQIISALRSGQTRLFPHGPDFNAHSALQSQSAPAAPAHV